MLISFLAKGKWNTLPLWHAIKLPPVGDCDGMPMEALALRAQVPTLDRYGENEDYKNYDVEWNFSECT